MYINSFCSISPAGIINPHSTLGDLNILTEPKPLSIEPDYKDLIPPMQIRRMSKAVRTGVAAAKLCLKYNNNLMPASIHVGTAYGMLEDSEQFLKKMIEQDEQMLNPTAFIQSTHNTVSGQIALSLGCRTHNMTYVHNGHSFESALLDASLSLEETSGNENILVGAVEECTDTSYQILKRFNVYNEQNSAGEGATFFSLSKEKQIESLVEIKTFELFKKDKDNTMEATISNLIQQHLGQSAANTLYLHGLEPGKQIAPFIQAVNYAPYSGKYATMGAFGLMYACMALQESKTDKCWLLNSFGDYYSLICLAKA